MAHPMFKSFRRERHGEVHKIMSETSRSGGGTFTRSGENAPLGQRYVYNPDKTVAKVPRGGTFQQYHEALARLHAAHPEIRKGERYVGTYRDEGGTVHFDPSVASDNLAKARRTAIKANQHSIWDRQDKREIVVCTQKPCKHFDE